jgi:diguanylate cyclase (GGDEF)-like protein
LSNRASFEQEMLRLTSVECRPLGIVVVDIDGLKLINETLGHKIGDELLVTASRILRKSFNEKNFIARIGGDEFAVLLPNTPAEELDRLSQKVRIEMDTHNVLHPDFQISLSIGYATSADNRQEPSDVFRIADHKLHRAKLRLTRNSRSDIVKSLLKTLETRNIVPEGKAERLQQLAEMMGEKLDLPQSQRQFLSRLVKFYDIGKITVSEKILLKPGNLDPDEYSEVKDHCETGFRIALTISDLAPIADYILKHHEWWNGNGYPLGLKGKDIPLESRILFILDTYDALTNDRPYRKAMTKSKALEIIRNGSGTQFDPELVKVFLKLFNQT